MQPENALSDVARKEDADEVRWRRWKAKGRKDEARFRRKMKTVVVGLAAVLAFGGTLWFTYTAFRTLN